MYTCTLCTYSERGGPQCSQKRWGALNHTKFQFLHNVALICIFFHCFSSGFVVSCFILKFCPCVSCLTFLAFLLSLALHLFSPLSCSALIMCLMVSRSVLVGFHSSCHSCFVLLPSDLILILVGSIYRRGFLQSSVNMC